MPLLLGCYQPSLLLGPRECRMRRLSAARYDCSPLLKMSLGPYAVTSSLASVGVATHAEKTGTPCQGPLVCNALINALL